jgi:hypothetical protein
LSVYANLDLMYSNVYCLFSSRMFNNGNPTAAGLTTQMVTVNEVTVANIHKSTNCSKAETSVDMKYCRKLVTEVIPEPHFIL